MKLHPFIGLIGPSGAGKTTLISQALAQLPDQVTIIRSVTTRPRRGPEDDLSYEFITREEILERHTAGHLVNLSEYAGYFYGFDRRVLNDALQNKIGLQALVESAIEPLRNAGYDLRIVKIIPEGKIDSRSHARNLADQERSKQTYAADLSIYNRFVSGGQEQATKEFISYLAKL